MYHGVLERYSTYTAETCVPEEGDDGGESGVLLVDLLRGSGAGRRVHGDPWRQSATQMTHQLHQLTSLHSDGRSLLHSSLWHIWSKNESAIAYLLNTFTHSLLEYYNKPNHPQL